MRTFVLRTVVVASALLALPTSAASLREVARAALAHDPRVAGGDAAVAVARDGIDVAHARDGFTLGIAADVGRSYLQTDTFFPPSGPRNPTTLGVSASQPLYNGGLTAALEAAARTDVEAALEARRNVDSQVVLAALTATFDVKRDREILALTELTARTLVAARDDAGKRLKAGEATRTDVSQATARLAEARAQVRRAQAQLRVSEIALERLLGQSAGVPDVDWPSELPVPPTLAQAVGQSHEAPGVIGARQQAEAARSRIEVARAEYRPRLSLDARAATQDDTDFGYARINTWAVQLKLNVPIFTGGLAQARTVEAQARAVQADYAAQNAEAESTEIAARQWELLQATTDTISAIQAQASASDMAYSDTGREVRVGSRTTLDLLNAEREREVARVDLVSAKRDQVVTALRLLAACGRLDLASLPD